MADKDFYAGLQEELSENGLQLSKASAKNVFLICIRRMFGHVITHNAFRFPSGFGALKTRVLQATTKRSPQTGEQVDVPQRTTIRYTLGKNVKADLNPQGA